MTEKRTFTRKKRRLIVDFEVDGVSHTGFTWDLSFTGLFVASTSMPRIGATLVGRLHLPDGKLLPIGGRVVREKRVPAALAAAEASGFSLELAGYNEEYTRFLSSL